MQNSAPLFPPMPRHPRHDILFEEVRLGPVVAKNRFYQTPHCAGLGWRAPAANAAMRAMKAEGGWAVVCTEECEFDSAAEISPYIEMRLWDDGDIPAAAKIAEAIHKHDALAGIELAHNGMHAANLTSREAPQGPANLPCALFGDAPVQARMMNKADIARLRRLHRQAVLRAKRAGFDIVYVYAAHGMATPQHFLSRRYNDRGDEYGGSLKNRARLLRELIADAKDAVGDACAIAARLALFDPGLTNEEVREVVADMGDLPDLWDFAMGDWESDSQTSRFGEEGAQEKHIAGIKALTSKPVVGVGRFTSPDAMAAQIRRGVLDLIGAARPSIADPFLPEKIKDGRIEDIRECIGCNVCVAGDMTMSPIRCTQNPTTGEEWRRGWHPEKIAPKKSAAKVLIIGAGPAGLECARALGARGYPVTVAEAAHELGGRVAKESRLPGLAAWGRVRDYRIAQIRKMPQVEVYLGSKINAEQALAFGFSRVVVAAGAKWRRDGVGRRRSSPLPIAAAATVYTPDDICDGKEIAPQDLLVYDDDHYYLGGVIAEYLAARGGKVTLLTPAALASAWTRNTLEQPQIQRRLLECGVEIIANRNLEEIRADGVVSSCVFTGQREEISCNGAVLVTARLPDDEIYRQLSARRGEWNAAGIADAALIGDAFAPATIAAAVWSGHRYARELDEAGDDAPFRREMIALDKNGGG